MIEFPEMGKVHREFFDEVIYPRLGASRPEVIIGPGHGVDNAVIKVGGKQVMIITTDPLSIIPSLGLKDSAWLSVHLLASDITTSGFPPSYIVVDLNLPLEMKTEEFSEYWETFHQECIELGVGIVSGHTGRYYGCNYTVVGGGTMIAIGSEDHYISASMAEVGDKVIVTKGVAIATTGILSRVFPKTIEDTYGTRFLKRAQSFFYQFTTVEDALTAATVGVRAEGVTAMHDATEGGVLAALYELAYASRAGIRVEKGLIPTSDEALNVCKLFDVNPYTTLGEGSLVISAKPDKSVSVVEALRAKNIPSAVVGEITESGMSLVEEEGEKKLTHPRTDPYWKAFTEAVRKGYG